MKPRIHLINCDSQILNQILEGNATLAKGLNINVPTNWSEYGTPIFKYSLEKIVLNPESKIWWTYLPVEIKTNTLIGSCGYKGPPNELGMVEIGYEVAEEKRNRGFATEIAQLLIQQAFLDDSVRTIQAHTLAEENASTKVLRKCNFKFIQEVDDEEDGKVWKWELFRDASTYR